MYSPPCAARYSDMARARRNNLIFGPGHVHEVAVAV